MKKKKNDSLRGCSVKHEGERFTICSDPYTVDAMTASILDQRGNQQTIALQCSIGRSRGA